MLPLRFLLLSVPLALLGCNDQAAQPQPETKPPFVKTAAVVIAQQRMLGLSGTVRARIESPLAFQVGGRILMRKVDAGQSVAAGQALFQLDTADLEQSVRAAEADLAATEASLAKAQADLERDRKLRKQSYISPQALEHTELAVKESKTRRDATEARLVQARNAKGYAVLNSTADGILIEVNGEPGQVVAAGQAVATLAQAGPREIEVYFPEDMTPPEQGSVLLGDGGRVALKLRETAGSVDALGRTRRARYTLAEDSGNWVLGTVVRTEFAAEADLGQLFSVPISALDERGQGVRVWRVQDGAVHALPVQVRSLDDRSARIQAEMKEGEPVVALGTHLLTEGMAVRMLPR